MKSKATLSGAERAQNGAAAGSHASNGSPDAIAARATGRVGADLLDVANESGGPRELPHGWRWMKASEVGAIQLGRQRSPKNRSADFPTKYIRAANITERGLDLSDVLEMDFKPAELARFQLQKGDILLSEASGSASQVGKPAIWNGELAVCCFQNTVIRLRPRTVSSKYLFWLFTHFYRNGVFARVAGGVGINHLSAAKFAQLDLPIAPDDQQACIVAEIEKQFTRLDAGVAALRRAQANLKRHRAAVLAAACEGRLVPPEAALASCESRSYEPASILLDRIIAEPRSALASRKRQRVFTQAEIGQLTALPEGWVWAGMRQVGEVQLGRQRAPQHHSGDNMRPYLRVANVFEARLDLTDVNAMNFTPEEFERYRLVRGDILLNEGQTPELVGRPAMFRDEIAGCCYQKTLIRFRAHNGLLPAFALIVYRHYMHSGRFTRAASITTNIAHLTAEKFVEIEFPLPPFAEQERIVAEVDRRLSVVEELEAVVTANLQRAGSLRQSILQKAFTGALV